MQLSPSFNKFDDFSDGSLLASIFLVAAEFWAFLDIRVGCLLDFRFWFEVFVSDHDESEFQVLGWDEGRSDGIEPFEGRELGEDCIVQFYFVFIDRAVLIENRFDVSVGPVSINSMVDYTRLTCEFVLKDESFLILLSCILRIKHLIFFVKF